MIAIYKNYKRILVIYLSWLSAYAIISLLFCVYRRKFSSTTPRFRPLNLIPDYKCECTQQNAIDDNIMGEEGIGPLIRNFSKYPTKRILLLIDPRANHKSLLDFINYFKVPIHVEEFGLPGEHLLLELDGITRYSLIIFENYHTYHLLSANQKEVLNTFCEKHSIGIISFLITSASEKQRFRHFTAFSEQLVSQLSFDFYPKTRRISRSDCIHWIDDPTSLNVTLFKANSTTIKSLLNAKKPEEDDIYQLVMFLDSNHILFGAKPEKHWMVKIALLEAVNYLAPNIYQEDLERFVQIDIDDVFVGASGSRLTPDDVQALSEMQQQLRNKIENFTFTLGFSGYYFRHGTELEIRGDELFSAIGHEFHWFPHMWRHNHAQEHSSDYLLALMAQNKMFANNSGLPTRLNYAVSPQHSGVYPVYQPLYDCWKQIWNVYTTSTEEYPHLRPASKRRGFIHSNVSVLPRQTSGMFTHTQFFHALPEGIDRFLKTNIYGGDLFSTILLNKFTVFMTHQQNYANDRIGAFTFRNLLKFFGCWTNLRFRWIEPKAMASMYFEHYPQEERMLYTNPCTDKRHKRMLPGNYSCNNLKLPNLIILGPQKTGTSALAMFLQLHPNISTNMEIPHSFEELQFFAGPNYARGLDWYADKFATNASESAYLLIEKTANYFDNIKAPEAIHALLPSAKLMVILNDPVRRAYSWYQHMRAHNDSVALKYNAEQIFIDNVAEARGLRNRALWPGLYVRHLDRWLDFYPASQIIIVDGDKFRNDPYSVLSQLFLQLGLPPLDGLTHRFKFSPEKGHYCLLREADKNGTYAGKKQLRCLGSSKGRHYGPMSHQLRRHLDIFFEKPNLELKQFLHKYKFPVPSFLFSLS